MNASQIVFPSWQLSRRGNVRLWVALCNPSGRYGAAHMIAGSCWARTVSWRHELPTNLMISTQRAVTHLVLSVQSPLQHLKHSSNSEGVPTGVLWVGRNLQTRQTRNQSTRLHPRCSGKQRQVKVLDSTKPCRRHVSLI